MATEESDQKPGTPPQDPQQQEQKTESSADEIVEKPMKSKNQSAKNEISKIKRNRRKRPRAHRTAIITKPAIESEELDSEMEIDTTDTPQKKVKRKYRSRKIFTPIPTPKIRLRKYKKVKVRVGDVWINGYIQEIGIFPKRKKYEHLIIRYKQGTGSKYKDLLISVNSKKLRLSHNRRPNTPKVA
eukprot:678060_1